MTSSLDIITPDKTSTLPTLFQERAARTPERTAYRYCDKITKTWHDISWREMTERVGLWRSALLAEGLEPGDRVALMLPNCPEWVCLDQAAMSLGLIVVPLYLNDRAENVGYILGDTEAKLFLCQGPTCLSQMESVLKRLDHIRRIVTIDPCKPDQDDQRIACVSSWLPEKGGQATLHTPSPDDTATIVYTSGTTGPPKGVMLSHRNMASNAYAGATSTDVFLDDVFLSFLPLSHMLERTAGYYLPMLAGSTVAFARSIPELAEDLLTIQPTMLIAVPRIFEKIYGGIMRKLEQKPAPIQKLFHTAVATGWEHFEYTQKRAGWSPSFLLRPLLDVLVAKKVREKLGGRLRLIISGGAPLSLDIAKVFIGLGLPICQGYGLTETSPVISVNRLEDNNPSGVGPPLRGVSVKLGEFNELLVQGENIMQGYWHKPEATAEAITPDGWLHTGDRAEIKEGHIRITGRIKEVIVLSNGEKVSPTDLEMSIAMDPLFEQCMVIGEGRPYLALLAVLEKEKWHAFADELGVSPDAKSLQDKQVQKAVLQRVEKLMHAFPGYAYIKQVTLTLEPWTIERGLLTPTMKIRRKSIIEHMHDEIDALYTN